MNFFVLDDKSWYPLNQVRRDWRSSLPLPTNSPYFRSFNAPFFPYAELVYVNEKTYYVGEQCAANRKKTEHEE